MSDLTNSLKIKLAESKSEMRDVYSIRSAIFTEEQNIPAALDLDGKDEEAINILVLIDDKPIGTGRLYSVNDNHGEIARIAVIKEYRRAGIAKQIIQKLELLAKEQGLKELTLYPHDRLKAFYEKLGFDVMPNQRQVVANYQLIKMHKIID